MGALHVSTHVVIDSDVAFACVSVSVARRAVSSSGFDHAGLLPTARIRASMLLRAVGNESMALARSTSLPNTAAEQRLDVPNAAGADVHVE